VTLLLAIGGSFDARVSAAGPATNSDHVLSRAIP
jgi:hypothetical protein